MRKVRIPPGSIAWRQGALKGGDVWKYIPPPWDVHKPITLVGKVPAGAVRTAMRTPRETIQLIGRPEARVPETVSVDLGVVDIYITDFGRNIQFKGGGLETIVGERIMTEEKGMSIPAKVNPLGVAGLKFGTSLEQLLIGKYETEALRDFGERTLTQRLSEMSPEQIADEIKDVGLTEPRIDEVLLYLPDRARANVRRLLGEKEYIPLPGAQYAEATPSWRRMKALEAEALGEEEVKARKRKSRKLLKEQETTPSVTELRIL